MDAYKTELLKLNVDQKHKDRSCNRQARRIAKMEFQKELELIKEEFFTCTKCGEASREDDRSPGTTECIYC